ncbi:MAG: PIN domain-containing protein [Trebonia sp.]
MSVVGYEVVVYDSGVLVAISDPRNRAAADRHRERIGRGRKIMVPTVVAAQVVRKPAAQARLMMALKGCELVPFTADHHVPVGQLLARSGTADVVDAFVALLAARTNARVISSDPDDIGRLLSCLGVRRPVVQA